MALLIGLKISVRLKHTFLIKYIKLVFSMFTFVLCIRLAGERIPEMQDRQRTFRIRLNDDKRENYGVEHRGKADSFINKYTKLQKKNHYVM